MPLQRCYKADTALGDPDTLAEPAAAAAGTWLGPQDNKGRWS
jgi:hypothetical protein